MKALYAFILVAVVLLGAAANYLFPDVNEDTLKDGYYTAEAAEYYHGWKEFLTIYVKNGKIITAEYDAKNASGFIKSWDMDYMRRMNKADNNYPNRYTRAYVSELLNRQGLEGMDAMSGATESFDSFKLLAITVLAHAKAGNKRVAFVYMTPGKY
ncbi:MAG: FMN-binding protein [Synergistaceae bacterium]|jgi:major membrane immunogen (membrane-anchored lipoprotein)|nr:FMN-binding protein [Synergistaceae bacterium]